MSTADPYAAFREDDEPKEEAFAKLNELVKLLTKAEADVAQAQQDLKDAQARLRQVDEFDIPGHMDTLGLKEFINRAGIKIEAKTTVYASIGNRKVQAYAWLIANKHSGLIKRQIVVAFDTQRGEDAEALKKELLEREDLHAAGVKQEMKVEAASLTAFVRKQLKEGHEIPADIFGIYDKRSTKITLPSE
ncbi:hypothetical protein LCGC14_0599690 [marine sediment metagenome]|uniref:Uncharacterized protein n=1 Tax=marine sediment metagenome TaxID=412755 RepID=A0A0F9RFR4_9ZZZZ